MGRIGRPGLRRYGMRASKFLQVGCLFAFPATAALCACGTGASGTGFLFGADGGPSKAASQGDDGSMGSGGSSSGSSGNTSGGNGPNGDDGAALEGGGCPAICGGCCDPSGNCKVGTADTACGLQGSACIDCPGTSQTCQSGVCASASGSASGGSSG